MEVQNRKRKICVDLSVISGTYTPATKDYVPAGVVYLQHSDIIHGYILFFTRLTHLYARKNIRVTTYRGNYIMNN